MQDNQEQVVKQPKTYTYQDLVKFENTEIYSSFGKMSTSDKKSAPTYGFGTADRNKAAKVFQSHELSKTAFIGKTSPGANYDVTDQFDYKKAPTWKLGSEPRNTLNTGPKYDFYLRQDVDFDPLSADETRKPKNPQIRIGLEPRFPNDPKRQKGTPGPQYNPSLRHEIPKAPQFSFGFRREIAGASPLAPITSTPALIGPGSYVRQKIPDTSEQQLLPKWTFPKSQRRGLENKGWDLNQTYDAKSRAIGQQANSRKKTLPAFTFGRSTREAKTGQFQALMSQQPTRINVKMPKF